MKKIIIFAFIVSACTFGINHEGHSAGFDLGKIASIPSVGDRPTGKAGSGGLDTMEDQDTKREKIKAAYRTKYKGEVTDRDVHYLWHHYGKDSFDTQMEAVYRRKSGNKGGK